MEGSEVFMVEQLRINSDEKKREKSANLFSTMEIKFWKDKIKKMD